MEYELDPPRGVGPLRLGMTYDEARAALETLGPLQTSNGELATHLPSGIGFSVGFGVGPMRNRVNAVEVWRPREHDVVRYRGIDIFGRPALEVIEQLRRHIDLVPHEHGAGFIAREVYLALWRPFAADDDPAEEQGYYFQSLLLAHPGYDDTPSEAAARSRSIGVDDPKEVTLRDWAKALAERHPPTP